MKTTCLSVLAVLSVLLAYPSDVRAQDRIRIPVGVNSVSLYSVQRPVCMLDVDFWNQPSRDDEETFEHLLKDFLRAEGKDVLCEWPPQKREASTRSLKVQGVTTLLNFQSLTFRGQNQFEVRTLNPLDADMVKAYETALARFFCSTHLLYTTDRYRTKVSLAEQKGNYARFRVILTQVEITMK